MTDIRDVRRALEQFYRIEGQEASDWLAKVRTLQPVVLVADIRDTEAEQQTGERQAAERRDVTGAAGEIGYVYLENPDNSGVLGLVDMVFVENTQGSARLAVLSALRPGVGPRPGRFTDTDEGAVGATGSAALRSATESTVGVVGEQLADVGNPPAITESPFVLALPRPILVRPGGALVVSPGLVAAQTTAAHFFWRERLL